MLRGGTVLKQYDYDNDNAGTAIHSRMRTYFLWIVGLATFGVALSFIAMLIVVSESGEGHASLFCNALVYLAYWPSISVGIDKNELFASFRCMFVNGVGWGIVGTAIATLFTSGKRWRKS